ncbi:unnamed protein product [Phyllotreta striolata]|uniref:MYND-type domain-containing protein n=1 Tax=Phyllotreta striolata TaxID=444603 RepID=A0A9N9TL89_PHYSR|nr:unnamed protein product [Phyllotreta striolata]
MEYVLLPNEIEMYVDTMKAQNMECLGSPQWIEWHQRMQKLNQEALVEASALKEERVKETLVCFGKVPILVHEAILISIWKQKILPQLMKLEPQPETTIVAYSIMYHEAVCVSLLELVLFHPNCCEALDDAASDLLEYSCSNVSQLLVVEYKEQELHEKSEKEISRQKNNLVFEIGMKSLTLVRYISENLDSLPVGVKSKIFGDYDVPILFTEILTKAPWIRGDKIYSGGKWRDWDREQLGQQEAQVWLTIRQLILDPECPKYYSFTDRHRAQLMKLTSMMTPTLLDQLSPLIELKHWLCRLSVMENPSSAPKPLLIETVLDIKESILKQTEGRWKKLAKKQLPHVFPTDRETLHELAGKLCEAYNTELLEKLEAKQDAKCASCGKEAIQRCSRCHQVWYCGRQCQVDHWKEHSTDCSTNNSSVNS